MHSPISTVKCCENTEKKKETIWLGMVDRYENPDQMESSMNLASFQVRNTMKWSIESILVQTMWRGSISGESGKPLSYQVEPEQRPSTLSIY